MTISQAFANYLAILEEAVRCHNSIRTFLFFPFDSNFVTLCERVDAQEAYNFQGRELYVLRQETTCNF
jgi:hypothetical protein